MAFFDYLAKLAASVTDIFAKSGETLLAVDAAQDKLVFWDESEGKLTYATLGTNLSTTGATLNAAGGGGAVATDAIWDAKGDLAVGTGANAAEKLTVGSNGKVLTAASGETTGAKWATLPTKDFVFQPTAMAPLEATAPAWETVDFGTVVATVASFDDTTEEYLNGKLVVPAEIDTGGTVTLEVHVSPKTGAASKNTGWTFGHRPIASGETIDGSYTDEDSGAKSIDPTTGDCSIQTWTETVANLGWAAGDTVYFRLSRDPSVTDDLTGDVYLLLFRIKIPVVI